MAIIREHLAHKGLGLHNDLQNESSIVGNYSRWRCCCTGFGTQEQKDRYIEGMFRGTERIGFRAHRTAARLGRHLHGDDGDEAGHRLG